MRRADTRPGTSRADTIRMAPRREVMVSRALPLGSGAGGQAGKRGQVLDQPAPPAEAPLPAILGLVVRRERMLRGRRAGDGGDATRRCTALAPWPGRSRRRVMAWSWVVRSHTRPASCQGRLGSILVLGQQPESANRSTIDDWTGSAKGSRTLTLGPARTCSVCFIDLSPSPTPLLRWTPRARRLLHAPGTAGSEPSTSQSSVRMG